MIIGEPGAGKTTLAKKIIDPYYPLGDESSTEGIEITQWNFGIEEDKIFRVNLWDFGGQEIYYATHKFFLTQRSLYILVADNRTEDTDFFYWLNVVKLLSNESPLIILKNRKNGRHREINEQQLRGQFLNLKENISANLATGEGLQEVIESSKYYLKRLEHIGSSLPRNWLRVREKLENDFRNYITLEEYFKLCEENGFKKLNDKLQLSKYLHDLGVCLHFQMDELLKDIIILKPAWATDAVYKVLDSETVIRNRGAFDRTNLDEIWNQSNYFFMQSQLLRLMLKFKLCYEIPSRPGFFIVPALLSTDQPQYYWDESYNLLLHYKYDFMPKGIITRFIVDMNPLIEDQKLVWKNGVVLSKEKTKAEVVENYHYYKGDVFIRVSGKQKKELMSIIRHEFDIIHSLFEKLKFSELVPCNCSLCTNNQQPEFYPIKLLYKYIDDKQDTIDCRNSYEKIQVRSLIDDINYEPEEDHQEFQEAQGDIPLNAQSDKNIEIHLHNQNIQENPMSEITQNHFGKGDNVARDKKMYQFNNSQDLAKASRDIKALLKQLSKDYPNETTAMLGARAVDKIENDPSLRKRVIGALKEAGATAIEEAVDHPAVKIVVAGVKGFTEA